MKVYTQVGGETGHSEEKSLGSKGPIALYPISPTNATHISGTQCMCMYMYSCIYSQSISCRRLLSLFSLSSGINVFVWHISSIRKHEYEPIVTITIQFCESLQSKLSSSEL